MSYQIAFVKTNQEITFRDYLQRHEIDSYLPVSKIQVKPRGKRRNLCIERAVYPHYVFLKARNGMDGIVRLFTGFLNWLQFGDDDICTVEDDVVMGLMEREATGEFDKISKAPGVIFQAGIPVKVMSGPLCGFTGVVRRAPKRQAIAKVEINGKIFDVPIVILAIVT